MALARTPRNKARILLIEDKLDQRDIISRAMADALPEVSLILVSSVTEAERYLQLCQDSASGWPQLILLDLYLPQRETGIEFLQRLKTSTSPTYLIPVLVFSVSSLKQDIQDAYTMGANSYLLKPMTYKGWLDHLQIIREYWFVHTLFTR
ncbi:response regulator [Larkinella soli]|uniref:response regulator n=1 Tax=Larkinella soli TaxID=1770527 RepID=UPI000FFBE875|nr:response regulator [Larkinella soli]